jgi:acyl-CoA thioesterase-2
MGDLGLDTAVERVGEGRYRAQLSKDWEIWGPMGGYIASVALRAAGAESGFERPASFFCHYLGVARFETVDLEVTALRRGRNAQSWRVSITQGDRAVLEATMWTVAEVEGLEHNVAEAPDVPGPADLPSVADLLPDDAPEPAFAFWSNFEVRPIAWRADWPPPEPLDPIMRQWDRFVPASTFDDPWIDAARSVILIDYASWPSASQAHAWKWVNGQEWIAPSLDLYVAFHEPAPRDAWLLVDGHSPMAGGGLVGWTGRVWSESRRLVASGGGQLLCRRVAPPAS